MPSVEKKCASVELICGFGSGMYQDENRNSPFNHEKAWAILRQHAKWDAPEVAPVDLTEDERALFHASSNVRADEKAFLRLSKDKEGARRLKSLEGCICSKAQEDSSYKEIPVGVILDMGSWVGKTVHSCITMALSDFYTVNSHYKTRIVLHSRDTHGEPLHALSAALDLLKKPKVQAIIGSESTTEAKLMAVLGDEARVPILSLSPTPSANKHPYFLQITQDETTQFKGIAALAELLKWKNVMLICEDTDIGRDMEPIMINAFKEKKITITYKSLITTSASSESIQKELHKLSTMATKNYIMHTSHSLASHILINAKYLGMMDAGYKWIITSKTMDFLNFMDGEVIESMQGAVGFKSYIPQSTDLHKVTFKWRKEHHAMSPLMERKKLNPYGIWAYDAVSALAMAIERTQAEQVLKSNMKKWETSLLDQLFRISFHGLGGTFQLLNGRTSTQVLEIIKVIGKRERRVGLWTKDAGFTRKIGKLNLFPDIIWPGGISTSPTHRMLQMSRKTLRIGIPVVFRRGRVFQVSYDDQTNSTIVSGFCAEVFRAAFNALAHDVAFEFIPFMKEAEVGKVNYNDLIDRVHDGVFDAAIGDITITSNRSKYVDFTLPFTDVGHATLSRNADTNIWIFMKPLSSDLWVVSACFFILLGFVIWILEHRVNEEFQGSAAQQIGTTFWFAFSTLVYAHREKLQSNLSRFVVIVWLFVVLVLVSSYTATLSSLLTVEQIQLASKRGSIGYNSGSIFQGTLVRNLNFQDTRLKPYNSAEEYADALSRGSKRGGVDAIVDEIPYIKEFLADYPSGYSMTVSKITSNGFGFAFPKGSSLAPEMSIQIAKLREDGTLKLMEDKWFNEQSYSLPEPKILNLEGFRGLFLISGVAMASAVFFFMLYFIHEKVNFTYDAAGRKGSIHQEVSRS
ncbi:extracellular ligand-binding receptor [Tanacetum coccineum]